MQRTPFGVRSSDGEDPAVDFTLDKFQPDDGTGRWQFVGMAGDDVVDRRVVMYETGIAYLDTILRRMSGPEQPQDDPPSFFKNSLLAPFERFPFSIKHKYSHLKRSLILISYLIFWLILINSVLRPALQNGANVTIDGKEMEVLAMSCTGSDVFWAGKNQHCGLGGELCLPKEDEVIIKCPALCDRGWTYSSTPVGNEMVKYRQYTIGGGAIPKLAQGDELTYPYRGDSFPCSSAVHAGIVSPILGGCVKMKFHGAKYSYDSKQGAYGTSSSVGFNSFFPLSFVFEKFPIGTTIEGCYDPRFAVLMINFLLGIPVIYLASGMVSFWVLSLVGFWTVVLALDPSIVVDAHKPESVATIFSIGFGRLLPLCFVLYVMWISTIKRTFSDPSSPLAKTFLWYPLFWAGIANNITFDRLPVDRITLKDIQQMPGGFITILCIFLILIVGSVIQAYQIWNSGRLITYAKFYGLALIGLISIGMLPGLGLRVHHYILGMIFLPGTSTRGSFALILQGVLLGLMISGIARWDFAPIAETDLSLMRGEAGALTEPPANLTYVGGNVTWVPSAAKQEELNGYSLLLNDVERYVGTESSISIEEIIKNDKQLKEIVDMALVAHGEIPLYLRVAKSSTEKDSFSRGDYTRAGILYWPSGNWTGPEPGVT